MQKTLALLEKNVEWVALALGGLFVLWSAYAYVYIPPATVPVANQILGPGEVSEFTNIKLVKDMKRQITDSSNFKPIEVPQVVTAWERQMGVPTPAPALPVYAFNSQVSSGVIVEHGPEELAGAFHVNELVKLPKAELQLAQSGLSMVAIPGPGGQNGNAQPVANIANEDLAWSSYSAVVSAKSLQDAFAAVLAGQNNNPQVAQQLDKLYKTAFLEVQLQRQRATEVNGQPVFPSGDQGVEIVAAPRIQKDDLQPMPDDKANAASKAAFINWAEGHLEVITQPKFYDVKAGDIWNSPIAAAKPPAGGAAGARPPAANPAPFAMPNPNGLPPGANGANAAPGVINPLNVANDFVIWAHDETAKPGETYRYRLIYHMKNPVVDEKGIASPKIINVLDIASPPSDWSAPVTIARKTLFWVSSVNRNGTVQMDVFQYSQGQWLKTTTSQLWPGDQVPTTDLAIVDVHVGAGGMRDKYVLVADADGDIRKHSASERNDPKYKEMNDLVTRPAAPAATPVRGVPGGAPPPPPPMQTPTPHRTAAASGR